MQDTATGLLPANTPLTADEVVVVGVDETNLSNEYANIAAWIAHYGATEARAEGAVLRAKIERDDGKDELKRTWAQIDAQIRTANAALAKPEKITVDGMAALVEVHPDWLAARAAQKLREYGVAAAIEQQSYLGALCKALHAKRDMLVQIGANVRKEMEGELRTRIPGGTDAYIDAAKHRIAGGNLPGT